MAVLNSARAYLFSLALLLLAASPAPVSAQNSTTANLTVDLGYAVYQGHLDYPGAHFNVWQGIRYAAPPTADNRWRAPQPPATDRSSTLQANSYGPQCPQTPQSPITPGFAYQGDEDCLLLNVWAPPGAQNLPVLFYIHGGGYGLGNGQFNLSGAPLAAAANYSFVAVVIQYRLSAFGFLASPDIKADGALNPGLLDQHFALAWVQNHVAKFGGDPRRVTLAGQSAGAGSVMMQVMANGGTDGTKYFQQGIASSPFTPAQNNYSDAVPIDRYNRFAAAAGCGGQGSGTLACLRKADTDAVQNASATVGAGVDFGSWAFVPVTDGDFIRQRPSQQLVAGPVNGQRVLTSNMADEAPQFVVPNITTQAAFNSWLQTEYPLLTASDISQINTVHYPLRNESTVPFATCGDCGAAAADAINVGSFALGHQQRAVDLYSELTFCCPSYWLAQGLSNAAGGSGKGYKYQFSVVPSYHGLDLPADGLGGACPNIFAPQTQPDFCSALTQTWANFITAGNPSITPAQANGASAPDPSAPNPATDWPVFSSSSSSSSSSFTMLNLNQSGGQVYTTTSPLISGYANVSEYGGAGIVNNFTAVDASAWERGRGARCDFWRSVGYPS